MILTKTIYFIYLKTVFWVSLLSKRRPLCLEQDVRRALYTCPFQRERRFPHSNIVGSLISSAKDPIAHIFSVLWFGKVILRDSKTKSFPSICYDRQEEVVVVTASFVTRKTYLGNLGWSFSTTYPEQRVSLENISSVQGNIILCEKLKINICGKLRNNNGCKIVPLSRAFATKY